ncbi:hypothetical protein L3N51_01914 [Metallosphaera sp. J1]|uniref:hypothetical protein n=1 Tax=Metallosphaera TaxID=41980 RepID=UPI001EDF8C47|nr:hypothetical protein [Metallosphaera javensis (ex Hofmann et al. 2022)]MCG3109619.1 hypothetical protein [Metallosphaera javensis (ex Hofmann et al. 2022)]BCS93127.1 MAG: hypothetical protein MjAS7_1735 [Metallosphaera javensis (ex Sakai et al. 2022)]
MKMTILVGIVLIVSISVITALLLTHLPNRVPVPSNSTLNLNVTTLVPGIYAHSGDVCLVYFRPFQTVIIEGQSYTPENQGPPNGVFKLQNETPLVLRGNITIEVVIDNVPQNVTLPVFLEPVGVQPHGILTLNTNKS